MILNSKTLSCLISATGLLCGSCASDGEAEKPNIVVILFDDLGWDDLGVHGNTLIETPNIDALAAQSVQFDNFYVNPVCAASRASLLTGRHFLRTGVSHVHGGKDFMSLDETTIAQALGQNGYTTAMWGKWHSGDAHQYYPWQRGFQEALSLRLYKHRNAEGYFNGDFVSSERWADELIVDYAIDFIQRNKKNRFFAFVSLLAPHTPLVAPEEVVQKYIDKGLSRNFATLYAMVDFSDQELGRLFSAMDNLDITDNTIVMLLSDNGPAVNRAEISDEDRAIRYVNGYLGHKGDIWENGVKSPLFIRWPQKVQPQNIADLIDITDLFPTLLDIAGIDFEETKPLDGTSFKHLLLNEQSIPERLIYNYANKGWPPSLIPYNPDGNYNEYQPVDKAQMQAADQVISVRSPRYKLMLNPGIDGDFSVSDSIVLIDMFNDPKETTNIAWDEPAITQQLRDTLESWYYEVLNETTSYAPPVLHLKSDQVSPLRATWVTNLSNNLLNTVTAVKRWQGQHGWVEYQIMAPDEGSYEITLEYLMSRPAQPTVTLQWGEETLSGPLEDAQESSIGIVTLPQGLNNLRISIHPDAQGNSIDELVHVNFRPYL